MRNFILMLATILLGSTGCSSVDDPPDVVVADTTLQALASARGIEFGTASETSFTTVDSRYLELLSGQFGVVTPGNAMKFGPLRPSRTTFNWGAADALVDYAEANGMKVRGHTLVWHSQLASWVENGTWTRQQLIEILAEHISAVVGRYKGRVYAWDVVNEPFNENGSLRETKFLDVIGPDYIALAFHMAHEADPDAKLFLNEYNAEGSGAKSDAVYALAQQLLADGVPIDGIGLQMHLSTTWSPGGSNLVANLRRLEDLGLETNITEMDVRILMPASEQELAQQAGIYSEMLGGCLAVPGCTAFTIWGFTDRYSWIPNTFPGYGAALPFDEDFEPKPAYYALRAVLED